MPPSPPFAKGNRIRSVFFDREAPTNGRSNMFASFLPEGRTGRPPYFNARPFDPSEASFMSCKFHSALRPLGSQASLVWGCSL